MVVSRAGGLVCTGDEGEWYQLIHPAGPVVEPGLAFCGSHATGRSAAMLRSYGMDPLRWSADGRGRSRPRSLRESMGHCPRKSATSRPSTPCRSEIVRPPSGRGNPTVRTRGAWFPGARLAAQLPLP